MIFKTREKKYKTRVFKKIRFFKYMSACWKKP